MSDDMYLDMMFELMNMQVIFLTKELHELGLLDDDFYKDYCVGIRHAILQKMDIVNADIEGGLVN